MDESLTREQDLPQPRWVYAYLLRSGPGRLHLHDWRNHVTGGCKRILYSSRDEVHMRPHVRRWSFAEIGHGHVNGANDVFVINCSHADMHTSRRPHPCPLLSISRSLCCNRQPISSLGLFGGLFRLGFGGFCQPPALGQLPAVENHQSFRLPRGTNHLIQLAAHGAPLESANNHAAKGKDRNRARQPDIHPYLSFACWVFEFLYVVFLGLVAYGLCVAGSWMIGHDGRLRTRDLLLCLLLWLLALVVLFHAFTVTHKYLLTSPNSCNTVIPMANVLSTDKQITVIGALAEGSIIRAIERMTDVHRDTVMRLGVRVGQGCAALLDQKMRNLDCRLLQFDEIWGFIGKKERHRRPDDDPQYVNVWTFCAIDADTKLVPSFRVGKRDHATARAFVSDVASRMKNRVQISTDALAAYVGAIDEAFGSDVDCAQIVKTYFHDESQHPERKYSAPEIVTTERKAVMGEPDMEVASTSYVERLNGTTRLHMRRLTRLTYAFSKRLENFEAAVALHFAYYNFVKRHNTLRCTPAMAAGVEPSFWSVGQLVEAAT